jgi:hypothetical protein
MAISQAWIRASAQGVTLVTLATVATAASDQVAED